MKTQTVNKSSTKRIKLGNKEITIRKWKGKDKKAFINALKQDNIQENEILNTIVYSCIEEDIVLSIDEFKYVLSRIRAFSLGEEIEVEFYCDNCGTLYSKTFELKDVIRYTYSNKDTIDVPGYNIKLGDIKNKEIYIKKINEDDIYDLLLRIEKINDDDTFTLDTLIDLFDDMDIDILSQIFEQYEKIVFRIDDINSVTCTNEECKKTTIFQFDELPGFFPDNWFE